MEDTITFPFGRSWLWGLFPFSPSPARSVYTRRKNVKELLERHISSMLEKLHFISDDMERFYFGNVVIYRESGLLSGGLGDDGDISFDAARLAVIDLTTIAERQTRLLIVDALLRMEWARVRTAWATALTSASDEDYRAPTFVVVDEAHNLIPFEARTRADQALREQFRTIAAEGRKYGLYLILVSQRPDKLDALVLSECENRAIMRLGAPSVLEKTVKMLGLEGIRREILEKCVGCDMGRALMIGPWAADGPEFLYSAARRTVEGGRNLNWRHWATGPVSVEIPKLDASTENETAPRARAPIVAQPARSHAKKSRRSRQTAKTNKAGEKAVR